MNNVQLKPTQGAESKNSSRSAPFPGLLSCALEEVLI